MMYLTRTFSGISLLTLLLLTNTACLTTQSAVQDAPPPTPPPVVKATPNPSASLPADELIARIAPMEALRQVKAGQALLVDVRDAASYEAMRIKGATLIPFPDVLEGKIGNLPKDKHLIFYCTCPREHSAAQAAVVFQEKGYAKVSALRDGLFGYQQAGGEIVMK